MVLIKKEDQIRRDFTGVYKCEACGYTRTRSGYDDRYFHDSVIPNWKCEKCGKSSIDLNSKPTHVDTKYPESQVV